MNGGIIMFFIGKYNHNLDEKNRLIMPSKLRDKLGTVVYVTRGLDKCLAVYPEEVFQKKVEELSSYSTFNPQNRSYARTFFSNSYECEIDKQGRIQLTKDSLEKVGISKDVVIIGNNDHVEIWGITEFNAVQEDGETNFELNASKIYEGKGE